MCHTAACAADAWVAIGGQVKVPGRYKYTNGLTALTAIELAGGTTKDASAEIRHRRGKQGWQTFNREDIKKGKVKDPKLQADDEVFVPEGFWSQARRKL
jgi:protein involved in polysaccharide export with SLBB domain